MDLARRNKTLQNKNFISTTNSGFTCLICSFPGCLMPNYFLPISDRKLDMPVCRRGKVRHKHNTQRDPFLGGNKGDQLHRNTVIIYS